MQILIVGSDAGGALEQYCAAALQRLGHTIQYYDVHARITERARFLSVPVLSELELGWLRRGFNRDLPPTITEWKPDLVFVFKGIDLWTDTLAAVRALANRPLLINWNPDSPFDFATANTSRGLVKSIPLYDAYFIWDRDLFTPIQEAGGKRVEYLPFGYDPDHHHPVSPSSEMACQIAFVGNYSPQRTEMLAQLSTAFDVGIWGGNWHISLRPNDPLRNYLRGGWTYGKGMSQVYSAAMIGINFLRAQNGQAHNMRTFEVPAIGAALLSTRSRDQIGWLPENEAAAYFSSPEEMVQQAASLLKDDAARKQLAETGHRLITSGNHTYYDRMRTVMETVEAL